MSKATASPVRRRRLVWLVGAAVALAAAAGAGWYGWLWYTTPAPPAVPLDGWDPEAAAAVRKAAERVRREGRSGAAWGALGQVLLAHDEHDYSDACFAQAERFDPDNPRWPYYRGLTRLDADPAGAVPFLRRAVERADRFDRGNDAPRLRLAEALYQAGQYDEAQEELGRVLSWDPDSPRVHYDLGVLAVARGDDETAAREFAVSVASPLARIKSDKALAAIRRRQGDAVGAAEYLRQAGPIPTDPAWDDPYVAEFVKLQVGRRPRLEQARSLADAGRTEEALAIYRELAQDPTDAHAQVAAAALLVRLGRFAEAEPYCRAALGLKDEQAEANYLLTVVLCARGAYPEAEERAGRALELDPDNVMARLYLGKALAGRGKKKEAVEAYRRAVFLRPEMVEARLSLGEALAADGQKAEAVAELQKACDLAGPDDPRPHDALARARGDKP